MQQIIIHAWTSGGLAYAIAFCTLASALMALLIGMRRKIALTDSTAARNRERDRKKHAEIERILSISRSRS